MQTFSEPGLGTESGPPSASAYKRAVYKQAPAFFSVEVLPPQKQGNGYSYGMRIIPSRDSVRYSTASISSTASSSVTSSEYEVWRRWEDCLHFQDLLETQYTIMSREKRARLHAGKGVKKNGVYPHEDPHHLRRAASFESLPPGPDPNMIAKDVHEFLPKLTKKGTLFRASAQTIEQRGVEFKNLIGALYRESDEVPTLIKELRQLRAVRDFFGFWRRDHDRIEKERVGADRRRSTRTESMISNATITRNSSLFGGTFGMVFSASHLSLQQPHNATVGQDAEKGRHPITRGGSLVVGDRRPSSKATTLRRPHTTQSATTSEFLRSRKASTSTTVSAVSASTSRTPVTPGSPQSFATARPHTQRQPNVTTIRAPPASAPPGVNSFSNTSPRSGSSRIGRPHASTVTSHDLPYDDDDYNSDTPSVPDSVASLATFHTQTTERQRPPRSAPPHFMNMQLGVADSTVSLGSSIGFGQNIIVDGEDGYTSDAKGKGKAKADLEPEFDAGLRLGDEVEGDMGGDGYAPVPIGTHYSPPNESVIVPFNAKDEGFSIPLDIANRRSSLESTVDPILPSEGEVYSCDEDDHTNLVLLEYDDLILDGIDEVTEALVSGHVRGDSEGRFSFDSGGGVRVALQDLIEEDEDETGDDALKEQRNRSNTDHGPITPTQATEPQTTADTAPSPPLQPIPRQRQGTIDNNAGNRNGLVFTSPYLAATDFSRTLPGGGNGDIPEDISVIEGRRPLSIEETLFGHGDEFLNETARSTPRVNSPVTVMASGSLSPVSSLTIPNAEADGRSSIEFGPGRTSRRISTLTQSSGGSISDSGKRLSIASSVVMHSPLFDLGKVPDRPLTPLSDSEVEGNSSINRLSQFGGSMTSIDSIASDGIGMTTSSTNGVGTRRSMSPPPSTISSRMLSDSLRRSLSSGSRRPKRTSQLSIPGSLSSVDDEDELLESYFHGGVSPVFVPSAIVEEPIEQAATSPGREHFRGFIPHPNSHPKPFQNRPPGQFHLPWTPPLISTQLAEKQRVAAAAQQIASPPPSACSNKSFMSLASSNGPLTAVSSTFPEDLSGLPSKDIVAIKAVLGDSIVKFRSDRSISFQSVRAKLWEKFVKQQDVPLSQNFILAYSLTGESHLADRNAGRSRSNSVSSAGSTMPNQLRYIFSNKEWRDALSCCGQKLNLHILNDK